MTDTKDSTQLLEQIKSLNLLNGALSGANNPLPQLDINDFEGYELKLKRYLTSPALNELNLWNLLSDKEKSKVDPHSKHLLSIIINSLGNYAHIIEFDKDPFTAWETIQSFYGLTKAQKISKCTNEFINIKLSRDPMNFAMTARSLLKRLENLGSPMNEEVAKAIVTKALLQDKAWSGLVISSAALDTESLLKQVQIIARDLDSNISQSDIALGITESPQSTNSQKQKRCNIDYCGMTNHQAEDCFLNPKSKKYRGNTYLENRKKTRDLKGYLISTHDHTKVLEKEVQQIKDENSKLSRSINQLSQQIATFLPSTNKGNENYFSLVSLESPTDKSTWIIDSGASTHMGSNKLLFQDLTNHDGTLITACGNELKVTGKGKIRMKSNYGTYLSLEALYAPDLTFNLLSVSQLARDNFTITFHNQHCTIYDPLGVPQLTLKVNGGIYRGEGIATLLQQSNSTKIKAQHQKALKSIFSSKNFNRTLGEWHQILGHPSQAKLKKCLSSNGISFQDVGIDQCEICIKAKATKQPFSAKKEIDTNTVLSKLHTDVADIGTELLDFSPEAERYVLTITDDYSRYTWIKLHQKKHEITQSLISHIKYLNNCHPNVRVSCVQSDHGSEYDTLELKKFMKENGIKQQFSIVYTPQQNGLAERCNRTLFDKVRAMLLQSNLSNVFWPYAIKYAAVLKNALPTSLTNSAPFERFYNEKPDLFSLHPFGCHVLADNPSEKLNKLSPRRHDGIFLGTSEDHKGFVIYFPLLNRFTVSRNVTFLQPYTYPGMTLTVEPETKVTNSLNPTPKTQNIFVPISHISTGQSTNETNPVSSETVNQRNLTATDISSTNSYHQDDNDNNQTLPVNSETEVMQDFSEESFILNETLPSYYPIEEHGDDLNLDESSSSTQPNGSVNVLEHNEVPNVDKSVRITRSGRIIKTPERYIASLTVQNNRDNQLMTENGITLISAIEDPLTFTQAMHSAQNNNWLTAAKEEIDAILAHNVWELVDRNSIDKKPITSKWIFKTKQKADGTVEKYKARLCARGFKQLQGIDYFETFAPVVTISSIRLLLCISASLNLKMEQLDVKNAFLNGTLDEVIYMEQPEGFSDGTNRVCKLRKSLYGLKQAPACWFKTLKTILSSTPLKQLQSDPCVFSYFTENVHILLFFYVDDFILAYDNLDMAQKIKNVLNKELRIHEMGQPTSFLGMEITHYETQKCIALGLPKTIRELLSIFPSDLLGKSTPLPCQLEPHDTSQCLNPAEAHQYQSAVGKLIYIMTTIRPDLAYSVNVLSRQMQKPTNYSMNLLKHCVGYVKETQNWKLQIDGYQSLKINLHADASYNDNDATFKSTSGYLIQLDNCPIIWKSKKQPIISHSSTESELISLCQGTQDSMWIRNIIEEIFQVKLQINATQDNIPCIQTVSNHTGQKRTRHLSLKYAFIKEMVATGEVKLAHVPTKEMIADVLTKQLPKAEFINAVKQLGLSKHPAKLQALSVRNQIKWNKSDITIHPGILQLIAQLIKNSTRLEPKLLSPELFLTLNDVEAQNNFFICHALYDANMIKELITKITGRKLSVALIVPYWEENIYIQELSKVSQPIVINQRECLFKYQSGYMEKTPWRATAIFILNRFNAGKC